MPFMELKVFKQQTYESCLPTCLLILGSIEATKEKELEIIYNAVQKCRDGYYAYNILASFIERYNHLATLYVDSKPYSLYLHKLNNNNKIIIKYREINESFFLKLAKPFALYVDDYILGESTHSQHFIVIEELDDKTATIIDPWPGKRKKVEKYLLMAAVNSLKRQFLYSPLLIKLDEINKS